MEVDVNSESFLQTVLHSRVFRVSAWRACECECESVTRSPGTEFDSAEWESAKQGLAKRFGGFFTEMKRLQSSIEERENIERDEASQLGWVVTAESNSL